MQKLLPKGGTTFLQQASREMQLFASQGFPFWHKQSPPKSCFCGDTVVVILCSHFMLISREKFDRESLPEPAGDQNGTPNLPRLLTNPTSSLCCCRCAAPRPTCVQHRFGTDPGHRLGRCGMEFWRMLTDLGFNVSDVLLHSVLAGI